MYICIYIYIYTHYVYIYIYTYTSPPILDRDALPQAHGEVVVVQVRRGRGGHKGEEHHLHYVRLHHYY